MLITALLLLFGLTPGRYAVGYKQTSGVDLWYPTKTAGTALKLADYFADGGASTREFLVKNGLPDESASKFLGMQMTAARDAKPLRKFPLVLIAQGNGHDAADQAVLAEFLASHGYVVASVPSPMIKEPMTDVSQMAAFAEKQADALEVAIKVAPADKSRIAVIGHSFGARPALLLAMRHPEIRAVVSLDGGIGTATGIEELKRAPSFNSAAKLPPILHFYEELDPFMKPDFAFLRELHFKQLTLTPTHDMHHVHFTTYGFAPELAKLTNAGPDIQANVASVARDVLKFLNANLR